jgi:hypothetical protein
MRATAAETNLSAIPNHLDDLAPWGKRGSGPVVPIALSQIGAAHVVARQDAQALRAQGQPLRAIAAAAQAERGHQISHDGVSDVLRCRQGVR